MGHDKVNQLIAVTASKVGLALTVPCLLARMVRLGLGGLQPETIMHT